MRAVQVPCLRALSSRMLTILACFPSPENGQHLKPSQVLGSVPDPPVPFLPEKQQHETSATGFYTTKHMLELPQNVGPKKWRLSNLASPLSQLNGKEGVLIDCWVRGQRICVRFPSFTGPRKTRNSSFYP